MEIGSRLKSLRKKCGLTQAQLANALNISGQSISKWENDLSFPDISVLPSLAEKLSTTVDYILTGKENVRYVALSPYDMCQTDDKIVRIHADKPVSTYNGILPDESFPPRNMQRVKNYDPLPVPYLKNPPKVIDISIGRQLFVDDFLIEKSTFVRQYHKPRKYPGNPIFYAETPMEKGLDGHVAMAAPFSDGVFYDCKEQKFKMWYHAGWFDGTAYAESDDGINFTRVPTSDDGTNRVIPLREGIERDGAALVLNRYYDDPNPYKMFLYVRPGGGEIWESANGKQFNKVCNTGETGDRSTMFYNPFRKKWVYSMRTDFGPTLRYRARSYVEADTLEEGAPLNDPIYWMRADRLDPVLQTVGDYPSLYNLDAVAYESVMLGAFTIFLGPENGFSTRTGIPKHTELQFAYSRDGFHFSRPTDRTPAIAPVREDKNSHERGYIHSNNGICIVNGDELWFYYTSFRGDESIVQHRAAEDGMYANAATNLAILRRDGFASLNASGCTATLTTRPLRYTGLCLFVNGDFHKGNLRVSVLDEDKNPIPNFTADDCIPMCEDSTRALITWKNEKTLKKLEGAVIRLRFEGKNGQLYSFWIADDERGYSRGFLAAGSVGQTSIQDIDTAGKK